MIQPEKCCRLALLSYVTKSSLTKCSPPPSLLRALYLQNTWSGFLLEPILLCICWHLAFITWKHGSESSVVWWDIVHLEDVLVNACTSVQ